MVKTSLSTPPSWLSNSSLIVGVTGFSEMECRSASTSDERCEEKVVEGDGDLLLLLRRRRFGLVGGLGGGELNGHQ